MDKRIKLEEVGFRLNWFGTKYGWADKFGKEYRKYKQSFIWRNEADLGRKFFFGAKWMGNFGTKYSKYFIITEFNRKWLKNGTTLFSSFWKHTRNERETVVRRGRTALPRKRIFKKQPYFANQLRKKTFIFIRRISLACYRCCQLLLK